MFADFSTSNVSDLYVSLSGSIIAVEEERAMLNRKFHTSLISHREELVPILHAR